MLDEKKKMLKARAVRKFLIDNIESENYDYYKVWNHNDDGNGKRITIVENTKNCTDIAIDIVYEENGCNINLVIRDNVFSDGYKANIENKLRNSEFNIIEDGKTKYKDRWHINLFELPKDVEYLEILEKVVSIMDLLFK